ncbi:MAG: methylmalonyl Co-A mutase-associated GTPase MeaB [Bryobacteraceae bacterium]|nr:methylmalonyl Co-A mutase-associated GTPase MeaB [Bryobacteraceae bacterium]MDW8376542.1 methylmalonyl Co-A mutase-associated GTPase MeaB [Bryobacterales bacterium]
MEDLAQRILAGDLRALARGTTLVENRSPEGEQLLRLLFPRTGQAKILGVTGPPGAGKSTLINQLIRELRNTGATVGVLAVDPSSPFSGGAILGDRIRMQQHHHDPGVYIRSMATRGHLGGLAATTLEMAMLLDAAGREWILIETIGVGQDEIEIARLADVTLVVLAPGMGDDVQALKAGLMEIADLFVLNKSDDPRASRFEQELRGTIGLGNRPPEVPIVKTIATEGAGVAETLSTVQAVMRRKRRDLNTLWETRLVEMLKQRVLSLIPKDVIHFQAARIASREISPFEAVDQLLPKLQY